MLRCSNLHQKAVLIYAYARTGYARYTVCVLVLLALLLASCGSSGPGASELGPPVNGFGTQQNHTHSLAVLPDNVLLLASHYGLFRSADGGKSWKMVAAGSGQEMEGMMTNSLVYSPLNPKRFYVLTQVTGVIPYKGELGLYTSADEGQSWQLAMSTQDLGDMRFVSPGNDHPNEVFAYVPKLGKLGLKVSQDAGKHFTATGPLPFGNLYNMLAVPGKQGEILICGEEGVARSTDGGLTWQAVPGVQGTIYDITTSSPGGPIYVAGDDGVFASQDGGKSFSQVYSEKRLSFITASPTQPQVIYGKTGTAIFRSADGGHTWKQLPAIKGNTMNLVADPNNPNRLYLSLSYPAALSRYDDQTGQWTSLTPKA